MHSAVLTKIQNELKAPKSQRNTFGKYNYRSCEDVLEAVKPLCEKHGATVFITDELKAMGSLPYIEAVVTFHDGTLEIVTKAQAGIDVNRKGMDVAQCFGASSSYARKYALNAMFLIDDSKDADSLDPKQVEAEQADRAKAKETPAVAPAPPVIPPVQAHTPVTPKPVAANAAASPLVPVKEAMTPQHARFTMIKEGLKAKSYGMELVHTHFTMTPEIEAIMKEAAGVK
jgi:hypothetical protein